jgi:hypothetical protein
LFYFSERSVRGVASYKDRLSTHFSSPTKWSTSRGYPSGQSFLRAIQ